MRAGAVPVADAGLGERGHLRQRRGSGLDDRLTASSAPVPSPRRRPRSRSGSRPSAASALDWAGSVERVPATHHALAPGAIRSAARAAAQLTTPSRITGVRRVPAWTSRPASVARSRPPTTRKQSFGVVADAACGPGAARRGWRWSCASSRRRRCRCRARRRPPAPGRGSRPRVRPPGVVLPMPMSPGISRSQPLSTSSSAIVRPSSKAASNSAWAERVLAVDAAGRRADPVIDDPDGGAGLAGEHVDRRAAGGEVRDHLRRDLGWVGGDAVLGNAVVGGDDHDPDALERMRGAGPLHRADPGGELLEPAERAGRFGELEPGVRGPACGLSTSGDLT